MENQLLQQGTVAGGDENNAGRVVDARNNAVSVVDTRNNADDDFVKEEGGLKSSYCQGDENNAMRATP